MIRKRSRLIAKSLFLMLLYLMLFLYTITFSTPVSWLILYFFTVLLLVSFLSTLIFWGKATFDLVESREHQLNGKLQLQTASLLPILLPNLKLSIIVLKGHFSTTVPTLFKNKFTVTYENLLLPRGHHKTLIVESYGNDLFHLFAHFNKKRISADFKVYPKQLSSDLLYPTLKHIDSKLTLKPFMGQSDVTFRQLREHQLQDSLKDIDWKSSFKKQELMVKEYDKEIDTTLNLYFLGAPSPQFEELLSLTYSLYLELSRLQKVQLFLIGQFDQTLLLRQDADAFLTIQPTTQMEHMKNLWVTHSVTRSKKIVAAPIEIVYALKEIETRSTYFISEETLAKLHIGGN